MSSILSKLLQLILPAQNTEYIHEPVCVTILVRDLDNADFIQMFEIHNILISNNLWENPAPTKCITTIKHNMLIDCFIGLTFPHSIFYWQSSLDENTTEEMLNLYKEIILRGIRQ